MCWHLKKESTFDIVAPVNGSNFDNFLSYMGDKNSYALEQDNLLRGPVFSSELLEGRE